MSKPANPKLIGAFVLGAIALIVAGIVVLGGGKLFQRRTPVVMFFQGSVTGLSVGSPVNFRGVRVGQVTNVYIRYQPDGNPSMEIPVLADLTGNNVQIVGPAAERKEIRRASAEQLRLLVEQGLRAQLALPSLVTGQATISLDFFPAPQPISRMSIPIGWRSRRCRRPCRRCRRRCSRSTTRSRSFRSTTWSPTREIS